MFFSTSESTRSVMIYIFIFICLVEPEILHNNQHGLIGFDAYSTRIPERLKRTDIICNVFFRCTVCDTSSNYMRRYLSQREKDKIIKYTGILQKSLTCLYLLLRR